MTAERKLSREALEAMAAQVKAAVEAGEGTLDLDLSGAGFALHTRPDGGMALEDDTGNVRARMYISPGASPDDYPDDLPFIPGESVTLMRSADSMSLIWWAPADPAALMVELQRQTEAAGWVLTEEAQVEAFQAVHRNYAKSEMERYLTGTAATVMLLDKRVAPRE